MPLFLALGNISLIEFVRRFTVYWAPLLLWMGGIFAWSSLSGGETDELGRLFGWLPFTAELAHLGLFAVLAALAYRAFRSAERLAPRALWGAVLVFTILYAVSDEAHQAFVPGRSPSFADLMLDAVGGVVGLACAEGLARMAPRFSRRAGSRRGGAGMKRGKARSPDGADLRRPGP